MNILAIDLGTKTGYAFNRGNDFQAGAWVLASDREVNQWGKVRLTRRNDPRIERLCEKLTGVGKFDVVIFEDCQFKTYLRQAQLWPAFRSALWLCVDAKFFECVDVQTLKKFAGARSNDKIEMSNALRRQHPNLWNPEYSDDAIDAIWLHLWAQKNLTRLQPQPKLP